MCIYLDLAHIPGNLTVHRPPTSVPTPALLHHLCPQPAIFQGLRSPAAARGDAPMLPPCPTHSYSPRAGTMCPVPSFHRMVLKPYFSCGTQHIAGRATGTDQRAASSNEWTINAQSHSTSRQPENLLRDWPSTFITENINEQELPGIEALIWPIHINFVLNEKRQQSQRPQELFFKQTVGWSTSF